MAKEGTTTTTCLCAIPTQGTRIQRRSTSSSIVEYSSLHDFEMNHKREMTFGDGQYTDKNSNFVRPNE